MKTHYVAAAVQMNSSLDKRANMQRAEALVREAAAQGASLVALPEMFNCLGPFADVVRQAESIPGPTSEALGRLAAELNINLLAGSICERGDQDNTSHNTSLLFSPDGEMVARYRKIHLFDVNLPGRVMVQESQWIAPGDEVVTAVTSLGRLGMSICYDLRFPELYRQFAEAAVDVLFVPAAFTKTTGRDHWEVLLRARAIENQAFVIAPNQCGRHTDDLVSYGHSMIIDAWGTVLARAAEEECVITAEIDLDEMRNVRAQLPALRHRRWAPVDLEK